MTELTKNRQNGNSAGRQRADEVHIVSFVVHARPERVTQLRQEIEALPGAEVARVSSIGKLVVYLEADRAGEVSSTLSQVSALQGVASTTLVYHQVEPAAALNLAVEADHSCAATMQKSEGVR